ncbi:DNA repair protein Rad4 family [Trifolium repens]|nr:DNA repair protein Rad4 family [Trifolium repens]
MRRIGSGSRRKKKPFSPAPSGSLTEISRDAVGRLLRRANKVGTSKKKAIVGLFAMDDHSMTIELNVTPDSSVKKQIRRASAEDKELAELVHKVQFVSRGRLVHSACDDPLIQASLLSLLQAHLLQLSNVPKLTSKALYPLIS